MKRFGIAALALPVALLLATGLACEVHLHRPELKPAPKPATKTPPALKPATKLKPLGLRIDKPEPLLKPGEWKIKPEPKPEPKLPGVVLEADPKKKTPPKPAGPLKELPKSILPGGTIKIEEKK